MASAVEGSALHNTTAHCNSTWHPSWHWVRACGDHPLCHCFSPVASMDPLSLTAGIESAPCSNPQLACLHDRKFAGGTPVLPASCVVECAVSSSALLLRKGTHGLAAALTSVVLNTAAVIPPAARLAARLGLAPGNVAVSLLPDSSQSGRDVLSSQLGAKHEHGKGVSRYLRAAAMGSTAAASALIMGQPAAHFGTSLGTAAPSEGVKPSSPLQRKLGVLEASLTLPMQAGGASAACADTVCTDREALLGSAAFSSCSRLGPASVGIIPSTSFACSATLTGVAFKQLSVPQHPPDLTQEQHSAPEDVYRTEWRVCAPSRLTPSRNKHSSATPFAGPCPSRFASAAIAALQTVSRGSGTTSMRVLTCGRHQFPFSEGMMAAGSLPGLLRTAVLELGPGAVDGGRDVSLETVGATQIPRVELQTASGARQIQGGSGSAECVCVSGAAAYVPSLLKAQSDRSQAGRWAPTVASGHHVVTGGTGTIGLLVAEWLLHNACRGMTLLGRSGRADSWPSATVLARECTSSVVTLTKADCAIKEDTSATALRLQRPAAAVMHAGGVLADATVANQTAAGVRTVFAPKVQGVLNIGPVHSAWGRHVLFSSIAALWGSTGQLQYSAANSLLDALSVGTQQLGVTVTSVNWGGWAGGGMAARQAATAARMERAGIGMVQPARGLAVLGRVLQPCSGIGSPIACAQLDLPRFLSNVAPAQSPMYDDLQHGLLTCDHRGAPPGNTSAGQTRQTVPETLPVMPARPHQAAVAIPHEIIRAKVTLPSWLVAVGDAVACARVPAFVAQANTGFICRFQSVL